MVQVSRLVASMRYSIRDMQGVNVSDFEIIEAINQAAGLLYNKLAEDFVNAGLKKTILVVDDTLSASLPSDFLGVHRVGMGNEGYASPVSYRPEISGTYRILGNTFYAPEGLYGLEYYYIPKRVSSLTDNLDVMPSVCPYLERVAGYVLANDLPGAVQTAAVCSHSLAGNEITHFNDEGPLNVLGGKL